MPLWSIWILVAIILLIIELATTIGIFGSLAVATFVAGIAAAFGASIEIQLAALVLSGVVALLLARRFIPRQGEPSPEQKTNIDALIGQSALVIEEVDKHRGRVKLAGEEWSARSYGEVFPVGDEVTIARINGAVAIIEEKVVPVERMSP